MVNTNPMAALSPILDQVIEFMETALQVKQADDLRLAELTRELEAATKAAQRTPAKVSLEKVADTRPTLAEQPMHEAFSRLRTMGLIDERTTIKLAARIKEDPNLVFPLLVKLAEQMQNAPSEGAGVTRQAPPENQDPDGFVAWANGKPIPRR